MVARKLLIVEDEAITALGLRQALTQLGFEVGIPAGTGEEAVERALSEKPLCILMDINLIGDMTGIEAVEKINSVSAIHVIYMTGYSNSEMKSRAMQTGPLAYLEKPVDIAEINRILQNL